MDNWVRRSVVDDGAATFFVAPSAEGGRLDIDSGGQTVVVKNLSEVD